MEGRNVHSNGFQLLFNSSHRMGGCVGLSAAIHAHDITIFVKRARDVRYLSYGDVHRRYPHQNVARGSPPNSEILSRISRVAKALLHELRVAALWPWRSCYFSAKEILHTVLFSVL